MGEAVAAVIATSAVIAEDALNDVVVDWESLPAVADPEKALEADSPRVFDDLSDNVEHRWSHKAGAMVRVEPSGTVAVYTGISPHGQGQETTFAQIVADEIGVDYSKVIVRHGDTAAMPMGCPCVQRRFGERCNQASGGLRALLWR
ncbi:MAG: molybdopterin cofactor-binding domain-containing protein [Aggregatilineales bacterium]